MAASPEIAAALHRLTNAANEDPTGHNAVLKEIHNLLLVVETPRERMMRIRSQVNMNLICSTK
jgi:hypothetical protein